MRDGCWCFPRGCCIKRRCEGYGKRDLQFISDWGRIQIIIVCTLGAHLKFSELVRLLEAHGFMLVKEKGSIRYYGKAGWPSLIRVDYHGAKEVPSGTCHHILKSAGIKKGGDHD